MNNKQQKHVQVQISPDNYQVNTFYSQFALYGHQKK